MLRAMGLLRAGLSIVSFVSLAMATTTCPTNTSGGVPYSDYNPNGSPSITCTTNNLTFSDFSFTSTATNNIVPTPASVSVTVLDVQGNEGFAFNPGLIEGPGQSQDVTIDFAVTAAPGTTLSDLFIFFNGSGNSGGSTSFSETYCTQSFTTGCQVFSVPNAGQISTHIDISPTTTLFITKDFGANGGPADGNGSAGITRVVNQFSNVPEPAGLSFMLVGGLAAGLGLAKLFKKA